MKQTIKNKIFLLDGLVKKVESLKKAGKVVVQSHGTFDLIHPGIIKHLNEAKKQGDVLIVTVIKDKDVKKGYGRPIFSENLRMENIASLEMVDFICLVSDKTSFECVKRIKPNIFAEKKANIEKDLDNHEKIYKKQKELYFGKSKIYKTDGFPLESSQIINNFLTIYPDEVREFLKEFSQKYDSNFIAEKLNSIKKLKVMLIGDGIIDEYFYCESMGKSPKAQLIVHKYINREVFAGGAFAIANHIAGLSENVNLVSLLGKYDTKEDFISNNLKPNVSTKFFYRDDGPTITKKRYINIYREQKIFEINHINDNNISDEIENEIIDYLKSVINEYDLVLVSDFGHGFITQKIINLLAGQAKKLAVNAQTNGANAGYNLITKYSRTQFICLDASEARLAAQNKYSDIEDVVKILCKKINAEHFLITLGCDGSICVNKKGEVNRTPAFASKVVDIIGAGDAFFSYTAPCFALGMSMDLVSFIGNTVGALAVQIVGNKKSVEKHELLEFIYTLLK
ncbi:MAG TPA: PfkB family carbohydrate kinase [Nitrospinota bacterium]|jgi:rfaE bifunctional protein kinase chain/domain|nr:PfkB family carbohydrate kinase [Nitrospinota bacterium]